MKRALKLGTWFFLVTGALLAAAPFVMDGLRAKLRPTPALLEEATAILRASFEDGDCAVIRPAFFSLPASRLLNLGAGTARWPFEALFVAEELEPHRLQRCGTLWWLSFFGRESAPFPLQEADILEAEAITLPESLSGRGIKLTRLSPRTISPLQTLSEELGATTVSRGPPSGPARVCPWRGDRHRCGSQPWLDVRLESRHVGHHEVHWPYLHPGPGQEVLHVKWRLRAAKDPEQTRWILFQAGLSMEAVRRPQGSEVTIELWLSGERVGVVTVPPRRWALWPSLLQLPPSGDEQTLEIRIQSDDPEWRELLVDAWLLDTISPSVKAWVAASHTRRR